VLHIVTFKNQPLLIILRERKWKEKDYLIIMVKKEKIKNSSKSGNLRKIVVPGETIVSGEEYLPSDLTYRDGEEVVAKRFGLADVSDKLVRVIPLSGVYQPRRGNSVIGEVIDITFSGWLVDFGGAVNAFLSLNEVPRFINKEEMKEFLDFGDVVFAKVWGVKDKSVDLSMKMRNFGKLQDGQIIKVNPNKVPRIIGKEGSMVNLIKNSTGCEITVGQNGWVWLKADEIENELKAKKIIEFICEKSFISGLTEQVEEFVKKLK